MISILNEKRVLKNLHNLSRKAGEGHRVKNQINDGAMANPKWRELAGCFGGAKACVPSGQTA
jgi:transposase